MSKQEYWDNLIVDYYRKAKPKMGTLVILFTKKYAPQFIVDKRVTAEGADWFNSLELRRCRDRQSSGQLEFCAWTIPLDTFIGMHSLTLLLALEDSKQEKNDILRNIRLYKWVRLNHTGNANRKKVANTKRRSAYKEKWEAKHHGEKWNPRLFINFRENDKRANWSTVK